MTTLDSYLRMSIEQWKALDCPRTRHRALWARMRHHAQDFNERRTGWRGNPKTRRDLAKYLRRENLVAPGTT